MTDEDSRGEEETYRKLITSMIWVVILIACAAILLALGQCARKSVAPREDSATNSGVVADVSRR